MTPLERFHACMHYQPVDRVPNHEVGVWTQTKLRWKNEGLPADDLHWDWFTGEQSRWDMDPREYIPVRYDMIPPFEAKDLSLDPGGETKVVRHANGVVSRELITGAFEGMRASMDEYLSFPVQTPDDWAALKKRYRAASPGRYPQYWEQFNLPAWKSRRHPLILGTNCSTLGFYWRAREWMGTENLSYAWYDQPRMMHDMMEFIADFTIETSRSILDRVTPDYIFLNEDMSMKSGPLLSPGTYRDFILPRMKRLVAFFKKAGVPWFVVDSDGDCRLLLPMMMDAGVDAIWPMERPSGMDPLALRKQFGRALRLWGGVDKRELAKTPAAIDAHLRTLVPLVAEGGYIPTVDHLIPPDVPLANFEHYMQSKQKLLRGEKF